MRRVYATVAENSRQDKAAHKTMRRAIRVLFKLCTVACSIVILNEE